MSNTLRRRPWYHDAPVGKRKWQKVHNDKTCKPGCGVCGKAKWMTRTEQKAVRRGGKSEIDSQLLGTRPPSVRVGLYY